MAKRQQVIDDLLALVRKFAAETLLEEIANGDSQAMPSDTPKHLAALHELRDRYDWRLNKQPNNHWHPREPIELISYDVDGRSRSAQTFCNALLMISDLEGGQMGYTDFRWSDAPGEDWFLALPEPIGPTLLAGFEVLHREEAEAEDAFWSKQPSA